MVSTGHFRSAEFAAEIAEFALFADFGGIAEFGSGVSGYLLR